MQIRVPRHIDDVPENKILVLGISPGRAGSREASKSVQRVNRWLAECGIDQDGYDWQNCSDIIGHRPKQSEIEKPRYEVALYEKVICLGNIPARWCKSLNIPHIKVPHPSGINRKWNDPATEPQVVLEITNYLNGAQIG